MVEMKLSRTCHASTDVGAATILDSEEVNSLAQCPLADLGICLKIEPTSFSQLGVVGAAM